MINFKKKKLFKNYTKIINVWRWIEAQIWVQHKCRLFFLFLSRFYLFILLIIYEMCEGRKSR
jgi:hypothetical protein